MKKWFLLLIAVMFSTALTAQTVIYRETFEAPSGADSVISSGTPNPWAVNGRIYAEGVKCDSNYVQAADTSFLTTISLDCSAWGYVVLNFSHICKIEIADAALIQVSVDNGLTWTQLSSIHYIDPGSQFVSSGNRFNANAYPLLWQPMNNSAVPTNAWWKNEQFDISSIAANKSNVKIRFVLADGNLIGANYNRGWFLDNIFVQGAVGELIPPQISMRAPIIQDTLNVTGPFDVSAYIWDASGIDTAYISYQVNNGIVQYIPMAWVSDSTYTGSIPSYTYGNRIDYSVHAIDNSQMHNATAGQAYWFYIKRPPFSITIGEGTVTTPNYYPFYNYYKNNKSQMLYKAAEIGMAGNLTHLGFNLFNITTDTIAKHLLNLTVKIKAVSINTLGAAFVDMATATTVYNASSYTMTALGWNMIDISDFLYDGTSNLIVEVIWGPLPDYAASADAYNVYRTDYAAGTDTLVTYGYDDTNSPATYDGNSKVRPNIRFRMPEPNILYDAGVIQISNPTALDDANVSVPVTLRIRNFGQETLLKAQVQWKLDNVLQTAYAWTGNLQEAVTSPSFDIGTINVPAGQHTLKIWTEFPNDSLDQRHSNDTMQFTFYACDSLLHGTYSVGPTGDFADLAAVMNSLAKCGIDGPCVFNIQNGTYNGKYDILPISGASAVNTVTFQSLSGNRADVTLAYAATGTTDNYVVNFNGADHIRIKNVTLQATGTDYSRVLTLGNVAINNIFDGNRFLGSVVTSGSSTNNAVIYSSSSTDSSCTFNNNIIENGSYGMYWYGTGSSTLEKNTVITNNTYLNQYYRGLQLYYQNAPQVQSNSVVTNTASTSFYGMQLGYCDNGLRVLKNNVKIPNGGYGMYVNYCDGASGNEGLIANNMISVGGTSTSYGLYNNYCNYQKVYYNSVNVYSNASTAYAYYLYASSTTPASFHYIKDNIFAYTGINTSGLAAYISYTAGVTAMNYNDLFSKGTNLGYWGANCATLAAWKTASSKDTNSVSINPEFLSASDLHTYSMNVSGLGTPLSVITDDFDGQVRNATAPDLGADEFDLLSNDLSVQAVMSPQSGCQLTAAENISVSIKNSGSGSLSNVTMYYTVNNGTPVSGVFAGPLASGATTTYTFPTTANLSAFGNYTIKIYNLSPPDMNPANDTARLTIYSGYIFPIGGYTQGFEASEYFGDWTKLSVNGDAYTWEFPYVGNPHGGANSARFYNGSTNAGGDWLFSRCFPLEAGKTYEISYWYRGSSTTVASKLKLKYGLGTTVAAMTTLLDSLPNILNSTYQKSTKTFVAPSTGSFNFGWCAFSTGSTTNMNIDDINIRYIPSQGAAIAAITAPVSGCGLTAAEPVTIRIKNLGSVAINGNLTAYYQVNGQTPVSQAVPSVIAINDSVNFTFSTTVNMSTTTADSTFNFKAWISLLGDPYQSNDTITKSVLSRYIPAIPWVTNDTVVQNYPATLNAASASSVYWYTGLLTTPAFYNGNTYVTPPLTATTTYYVDASTAVPGLSQSIGSGTSTTYNIPFYGYYDYGWSSILFTPAELGFTGRIDSIGFYVNSSVTDYPMLDQRIYMKVVPYAAFSSPTLPVVASMTNVYTGPINWNGPGWQKIKLQTPFVYDGTGSLEIAYYNMDGVYVSGYPNFRYTSTSTYMAKYKHQDGSFPAVDGSNTYNRPNTYFGYTGSGCSSARVPVSGVVTYPAEDLAIIELLSPADGCTDGIENVSVRLFNNGIDTIQNAFNLGFLVSGNPTPVIEVVNTDILPGDSLTYNFTAPAIMSVLAGDSTFTLSVFGNNAGDIYFANDTIENQITLNYTPTSPVTENDTVIYASTATLHAYSTDSVFWFTTPTIPTSFHMGQSYTTVPLIDTTTYYVAAQAASTYTHFGPVDNTFGGGGSMANSTYAMNFNVLNPTGVIIKTVDMYPVFDAGTPYTVVVETAADVLIGTYSGVTTVASGAKEIVPVYFNVPFGTGYKMRCSVNPGFFRNNTSVAYPYTLPEGISITGNTFGASYYYFFYNWQVSLGPSCYSPRVPVTAVVIIPEEDLSLLEVTAPVDGCSNGLDSVKVKLFNNGYMTIENSYTLGYFVSGYPIPYTEVITEDILPGDTLIHTFAMPISYPATSGDSTFQIMVYGENANDIYFANDTVYGSFTLRGTPLAPVTLNDTVPYGTAATLQATSPWHINWYTLPTGGSVVDTGQSHSTSILYGNETYYVDASNSIPGGVTTIGAGTSTENYIPAYGLYDYGWSSTLFTPAELGFTGRIDSIGYYVNNTITAYTFTDQKIFMKVVPYAAFTDFNNPNTATMTQVFSGPVSWTGPGWQKIKLQTPFVYDGTGSLEIAWINNDGVWTSGYPNFRYTSTSTAYRAKYDYQDDSFPTGLGSETYNRPNIYFSHETPGCTSGRVPVTAVVTGQPELDAGVISIIAPASNISLGSHNVDVIIRNYGLDTLETASVGFSVNGIVQTPFAWTGSLATGATDTVTAGAFNFTYVPYPGMNDIEAWIYAPNGGADTTEQNDTASIVVSAHNPYNNSMVYHLGAATDPDFPNFTIAALALKSWGVSAPVTILVENGTYTEQVVFDSIPGASALNTITFRSNSGVNTAVILQFASTLTASNYVLKLNNAEYLHFEDMTIQSTATSTYGRVIELAGASCYNYFERNILKSNVNTSSNSSVIYSAAGSADNFNRFIGNDILNGYYGVYFYGSSTIKKRGNQFIDNNIDGYYYGGIYTYYSDSIKITGNNLMNRPTASSTYNIYLAYADNGARVERNNIVTDASGTYYGIYAYYNNTSTTIPNVIANNFLSQRGGTGTAYGLYIGYSNYLNIYFNSVNINGGSLTGGRALYLTGGTSSINIVNNNLANTSSGYAYYIGSVSPVVTSNYNNLYTNGDVLAYWTADQIDLAALKTTSSKDVNSKSVDPEFVSTADLHCHNIDLYHTGTPIAGFTNDIDLELRNVTTPCIGADEFMPPVVDAGIISITNPTSPVGGGSQNITVSLRNFGYDTLTTVKIYFEVDGVVGAPYTWNGSLATGEVQTGIIAGAFTFPTGASVIRSWTSLPNNTPDTYNQNDTAEVSVIACSGPLAGTYSIGVGAYDFSTFNEANLALSYCGISGPVIFNVEPGIYYEQLMIRPIDGASLVNTVTFKSVSGQNSDVKLQYAGTGSANNYVVYLDGASFINFSSLTMESTTSSTYGKVVVLASGASYNRFEKNTIHSVPSTSSNAAGIYSTTGSESYNVFASNTIENGYYGIYFNTSSTELKTSNDFNGNDIRGYSYAGIYLYYNDKVNVSGNTLANGSNATTHYGIYMQYCDNGAKVLKNKVIGTNSGSFYGIEIYYCDGTVDYPTLVINNFVSQSVGTGTAYGIYSYYNNFAEILYNSVNISGGSATGGRAIYLTGGTKVTLLNNIFANTGIGYAYYIGTTSAITASDYNDIYSSTTAYFAYWGSAATSLTALQAASSKDTNSVSLDPVFISTSDLHVLNPGLNKTATPLASVTTDIDGDSRDLTTPDIGADEFVPLPKDIAVVAFVLPAEVFAPAGTSVSVSVTVRNMGSDTITNFNVAYKYAVNTPVSSTWNGILLPGTTVNHAFSVPYTAISSMQNLCAYTMLTGDGNIHNDTLCMSFTGVPVLLVPDSTDFENGNNWYAEGIVGLWEFGTPASDIIDSAHSPTHAWKTNLDGTYSSSQTDYLYTAYYDFTQVVEATLKFWHWYETEPAYDYGKVEYNLSGTTTWISLGYFGDPAGTNWYTASLSGSACFEGSSAGWVQSSYDLSTIPSIVNATGPVQFRFKFYSDGSDNRDGWAIDDFAITAPPLAKDAGVVAVVNPAVSTVTGSNVTLTVSIKNFGADSLMSVPVAYRINNGAITQSTWTGTLLPGATTSYTFPTTFVSPASTYEICSFTKRAGDTYKFNDTTCVNINATPAPLDAGISAMLSPTATTNAGDSIPVTVRIRNYGTVPLTSIPLGYSRNGVQLASVVWTGNLAANDSVDYTFAKKYVSPMAFYSLCAYSMLSGDANTANDMHCVYPEGVIGIEEYGAGGFMLWQNVPNPATGRTSVAYQVAESGKAVFELRNLYGQLLITQEQEVSAGQYTFEIDVDALSVGIYYYSVIFDTKRLTKKMVIQ